MPNFKNTLNWREIIAISFIPIVSVVLIGLQLQLFGWIFYSAGLLALATTKRSFFKQVVLIYISLGLLGLIPITTDTSNLNIIRMGSVLFTAVALPYIVSRFLYKGGFIKFKFRHGHQWSRRKIIYIFVTAIGSYFLIPFYLKNSGAYLNWYVEPNIDSVARFFIGINTIGIWDELFFVGTLLAILRHYLKFSLANMIQAVLFTAFLFEMGFTGWGPFMVYPFALLQGYVFRKTESLPYIITIHLTVDIILFLALINAHHPDLINIFIT